MKFFVSEYASGGAAAHLGDLTTEGRAMLLAVVRDALRIPEVKILTTWDARLGPFPIDDDRITVRVASSPDEEAVWFETNCQDADRAMLIAPETQDILQSRIRFAEALGTELLNCTHDAIRAAGDKWECYQLARQGGINIPRTRLMESKRCPLPLPVVVKPRNGAGCRDTRRFFDAGDFEDWADEFFEPDEWILQEFIDGFDSSLAVLMTDSDPIFLPAGEQNIEINPGGEFRYAGGAISTEPDNLRMTLRPAIESFARRVIDLFEGLRGWIGIDFMMPRENAHNPLLIEVNPRVTSTYSAYAQLCGKTTPIIARLLGEDHSSLKEGLGTVRVDENGDVSAELR